MTQLRHHWGGFLAATILLGYGCRGTETLKEPVSVQSIKSVSSATRQKLLCPIPLLGYEKLPGYQPGSVDPAFVQKPIAFVSPTLEGNPRFYLGLLQQPVKFCGTANDKIAKVKLFASGAYRYEEKDAVPKEPERFLGEASVNNGIWFFEYNFKEGRVLDIVAQGYDHNDQWVANTDKILLSLAGPDPR